MDLGETGNRDIRRLSSSPTKSADRSTLRFDDFRLKESIPPRFSFASVYPDGEIREFACQPFDICMANRNPYARKRKVLHRGP